MSVLLTIINNSLRLCNGSRDDVNAKRGYIHSNYFWSITCGYFADDVFYFYIIFSVHLPRAHMCPNFCLSSTCQIPARRADAMPRISINFQQFHHRKRIISDRQGAGLLFYIWWNWAPGCVYSFCVLLPCQPSKTTFTSLQSGDLEGFKQVKSVSRTVVPIQNDQLLNTTFACITPFVIYEHCQCFHSTMHKHGERPQKIK